MKVTVLSFSIFLAAGFAADSAYAQMSPPDYQAAANLIQTMSNSSAQWEICGVDTSAMDDLVSNMMCNASVPQESDLRSLYATTKIREKMKLNTTGMTCNVTKQAAQGFFRDAMTQIGPMVKKLCP